MSSSPTTCAHVLITRPDPEGVELAGQVAALGARPVHVPAFAFERIDKVAWPVWGETPRRLLVFASPRAVQFAEGRWPAGWLDGVRIAALGPATAAALHEVGLEVDLLPTGQNTSEGLLSAPELDTGAGTAVLLSAPDGRRKLADGLAERGWVVHPLAVYQRVPLPVEERAITELSHAERVLSTWTSGLAMDHVLAALPEAVANRVRAGTFVVISQRLADRAARAGAADTHLAPGPGNDALLTAIRRLSIPESPDAGPTR